MATRRKSKFSSPARITDADVNAAVTIITRDYLQDVQGIADEILEAVKSGEITDQDALEERLQQEVDGSQRVIYTFQSKLGLLATRYDDAYEDEFGEKPKDVAVQMAYAMMQDVRDALGDVEFED